jgi:hypothetical protein
MNEEDNIYRVTNYQKDYIDIMNMCLALVVHASNHRYS